MVKSGEVNKKYFLLLPTFLLIVITIFLVTSSFSSPLTDSNGKISQYGIWCYGLIKDNGEYSNIGCTHNTIPDNALNAIQDTLLGNSNDSYRTIALCNTTNGACIAPSAIENTTVYDFTGCGLIPNSTTVIRDNEGSGNWTILGSFVSTCDNIIVNVTRLRGTKGINLSIDVFPDTLLNKSYILLVNTTLHTQSG